MACGDSNVNPGGIPNELGGVKAARPAIRFELLIKFLIRIENPGGFLDPVLFGFVQ